jgi:LmbE family N-acetylglucosaminyl deacetylase
MPDKNRTLVIAPHPDDEVLGAGGTLLRRRAEGGKIAWLIMTNMSPNAGSSSNSIVQRNKEIQQISEFFGFDAVFNLNYAPAQLDQIPMSELVSSISKVMNQYLPNEILIPHWSDVHSDHRVTFNAVAACTKWFRNPSVKRVLSYETISETDFGLISRDAFRANYFVNIEDFLEDKLRAMSIYSSEMGAFPFPRSMEAITALAVTRGATSGFKAAEAFELVREVI